LLEARLSFCIMRGALNEQRRDFMSDIFLQLQLTTGGTILAGAPVLFNQPLYSFGNIDTIP